MSEHPEANQYGEYAKDMKFHESKKLSSDDRQVVLVDVDETICFYPDKRQYNLAEPNDENIAKINILYDEGWYVIYWTARGGSQKSISLGKCYYEFTWRQLESWGCKFHDLSTGSKGKYIKPACDFVIDDIVKSNRHFVNELHRRVYKKSKTKIPRLIVIERGKGRFHTHMILETPEHIPNENYRHLIQHSWLKSCDGISVSIEDVTDIKGLKNYLSKEVSLHSVTGLFIFFHTIPHLEI